MPASLPAQVRLVPLVLKMERGADGGRGLVVYICMRVIPVYRGNQNDPNL